MADKIRFECPEQDCGFATKSETQSTGHLIGVPAFRPGRVPRVLAKIEKQVAQRTPSGFQTVIGKDRIYIKRSRTRYSAYTSEMCESKNTPVPMNPPTTEQPVRAQVGNIIHDETVQPVKDKLASISAFQLYNR